MTQNLNLKHYGNIFKDFKIRQQSISQKNQLMNFNTNFYFEIV